MCTHRLYLHSVMSAGAQREAWEIPLVLVKASIVLLSKILKLVSILPAVIADVSYTHIILVLLVYNICLTYVFS